MNKALRALIFDSFYDDYKGVICQFRVVDGELRVGDKIQLMNTKHTYDVDEVGVLSPDRVPVSRQNFWSCCLQFQI